MEPEKLQHYVKVIEKTSNLNLLPLDLWNDFTAGIKSDYDFLTVSFVARHLGLYWPESEHGSILTVADCKSSSIHTVLNRKNTSKRMSATILRVMSFLAGNPVFSSSEQKSFFSDLLQKSPEPELFPEEMWKALVREIRPKSHSLTIASLAENSDLYWPRTGLYASLTVKQCLKRTIKELREKRAMERRKLGTILNVLIILASQEEEKEPEVQLSYQDFAIRYKTLESYPNDLWKRLIGKIRPDFHSLPIKTLSKRIGHHWPRTGIYADLTIGECLTPSINSLLERGGMGQIKLETILHCLSFLADNPEDSRPDGIQTANESSEEQGAFPLDQSYDWQTLASERWREIIERVPPEHHERPIQILANDLGLPWPEKNWESWKIKDCVDNSFQDLSKTRGVGKKKLETIFRILIHLAGLVENSPDNAKETGIWHHPLISNLSDREREVFEMRLLTAYEKPTLEELGNKFEVTRERIRQLEKKILKKISASGLKDNLHENLKTYLKSTLIPNYEQRLYLLRDEVPEIVASLESEIVLAIALKHKSIYQLLGSVATKAPNGWFFGRKIVYTKLSRNFKKKLGERLPLPIITLSRDFETTPEDLVAVALLDGIATPYKNFLLPERAGKADSRRAIRCYDKAHRSGQFFWPLDELIRESINNPTHNEHRNYRLSILRCQRLFLTTPAYVTIMHHQNYLDDEASPMTRFKSLTLEAEAEDKEQSNSIILRRILEEQWPITADRLCELSKQKAYQTGIPRGSLLQIFYSLPDCMRLAPGVYGPKNFEDSPKHVLRARRLSLNNNNLRSYCFARRSSEDCEEIFPLWDLEQEQMWFRKIRKKAEDDPLLRSFVSIARQSMWPEKINSEARQLSEMSVNAKFVIEPSWINSRTFITPDFPATMTALRYAREKGPLSWIRANHITCSRQLASESGVNVLILGLALGLLDRKRQAWWKPVPPSEKFDEHWTELESLFLAKELPTWHHPELKERISKASAFAAEQRLGFVRSDSYDQFIKTLFNEEIE